MKIPKKLKIGGHIVKIIEKEGFNIDSDCGEFEISMNTITIRKDLPKDQKEATLIHEIFHVCNTTLDHELLDSLAEQVYQVFKDNGLLKN